MIVGFLGFGEDASDKAEGEEVHFFGFVFGCGGGSLWLFGREGEMCMCVVCVCMYQGERLLRQRKIISQSITINM